MSDHPSFSDHLHPAVGIISCSFILLYSLDLSFHWEGSISNLLLQGSQARERPGMALAITLVLAGIWLPE